MPVISISISSPAIRLVAVRPSVAPVSKMSRPTITSPSAMRLLVRSLVSTVKSKRAPAVPTVTSRPLRKMLAKSLVTLPRSMMSLPTKMSPSALMLSPETEAPPLILVEPPLVRLSKFTPLLAVNWIAPPASALPPTIASPALRLMSPPVERSTKLIVPRVELPVIGPCAAFAVPSD